MSTAQLSGVFRRIHKWAGLQERDACSDGQLMDRFVKNQDERAFEMLLKRHGPMVLGVCRRVLRQTHDVEDAFQATFLVFMRKASSIRSRETVGNWLYGVAFRTALKAKSAAAKRTFKEKQANLMTPQASAAHPGDGWEDVRVVLDEQLERLPDKYRSLIVLCDLEGKPRREVAEKLQLADGTLSSRLATARKLLAQRLTRCGVTFSAGALAAALSQKLASAAVPSALSASSIQAFHALAAGGTTAGVVSSSVAALFEGVLKAMFLTKLKSVAATLLILGVIAGGLITLASHGAAAQQPEANAVAKTQDQPEKKGAESETKKQGQKNADAKKPADPFPFEDLKSRLKKHEDEIAKIRQAMLKEIADEEAKIAVLIKKEQDAFAGGDKPALARASALQNKKAQLGSLRFQVQAGVIVGGKQPTPLTEEQRLGVHVSTPGSTVAKQLGLKDKQGLVLDKVDANSPAAKAGLKTHDILLKVDGKTVPSDKKEFNKILAGLKPGTPVDAVILREGKEQTLTGLTLPSAAAAINLETSVQSPPAGQSAFRLAARSAVLCHPMAQLPVRVQSGSDCPVDRGSKL